MKKKFISIFLYSIIPLFFYGGGCLAADEPRIAPEHDITVNGTIENADKPSWKILWDEARNFARNNRLKEAKAIYKTLLGIKPNIVAASWEYCKLLIRLEEWGEAAQVAEGLLDYEPDNLQFLLTAGKIALENKYFNKSTQYYGQVLEADPVGIFSGEAMLGLVEGLKGQGHNKGALVVLEQYFERGNSEEFVLRELAQLSNDLAYNHKALQYYSILAERYPKNKLYQYKSAELLELEGNIDKASIFWRKYLDLEPDFIPFHQKLAQYYLHLGNVSDALVHLKEISKYTDSSPQVSLQIADLYFEKKKRPDKALLYYEQFLQSTPGNERVNKRVKDIRSLLAQEYLPIVENGAVENLWQDLDHITLDKSKIFLHIADLLHDKKEPLHELVVVEILFNHSNQIDLNLAYRLAGLQHGVGRNHDAQNLYELLDKDNYSNKEYLIAKAENEIQLEEELEGFYTYQKYLEFNIEKPDIIEKTLVLGGDLGLPDELVQLWKNVPYSLKTDHSSLHLNLRYIEALNKCGFYSLTNDLYTELLQKAQNENESVIDIYYQLADSLAERGFFFNAEQILRQNLARDMDADRALDKLVRTSIKQNRLADAWSWLELLAGRQGIENLDDNPEELPQEIHFLQIQLLIAEHEYGDAEDLIVNHRDYLRNTTEPTDFNIQSELFLVRTLYFQEEYERCLIKINELKKYNIGEDELYVIGIIIRGIEKKNSIDLSNKEYGEEEVVGFTSHIKRAKWFAHYDRDNEALVEVNSALKQIPQSMVAIIRKVEILSSLSRFEDALSGVNAISKVVPQEEYFHTLKLQLQFQSGKFDEIVEKIPMKTEVFPQIAKTNQAQDSHDTYFWKRLLLARALWAENRREESIEVYNTLLDAPVDSMFLEKIEVEQINFNLPPLKKSFWNIVSFTNPEQPNPIPTVMTPQFVAQNIGDPIDNLAASLYGKYRWQELVKKELSARKAVKERDYYHAEKEYLSLLEEEKSQESLFDLANIYHKLGLYGKAAELYELMKEKGPLYPGLDEYIQANLLKRQPRVSISLIGDTRKGREGYINRRKRSFGFETWVTPAYNQEVSVQAYNNEYRSKGDDERFRRQRVLGTYSTYFENTTDLNLNFGVDSPSDEGTTEFLYKIELFQRINKFLEAYGRFEQDLVEDTLRSVSDSVIYRDLETGLKYDLFPRWFVGADYRYRMYSDDNKQNRYKIWSQYHLFGEVNQFKLKYSYELIRNDKGNVGRQNDFSSVFAKNDSVYWSPTKYWQQQLNFHFKHYFEKTSYSNSLLNYCTLDYTFGYDENRQQSHEFDLNFFLEITRHFLLKGNLRTLNGDDIEETRAAFSLIYRW